MVSAQIAGLIEIEVQSPSGAIYPLTSATTAELGPSGSVDHAIASTPEKWVTVPLDASIIPKDSQIRIYFTADTAATTDESDAAVSLPFRDAHNKKVTITDGDLTAKFGDAALIAGAKTLIWTYETRQPLRFGGGTVFLSIENNA